MSNPDIRSRVLRGISLNRIPGFHFAGNFLDVSYDHVADRGARVSLEPGPHCIDAGGETHLGVVAMLADIALAASVRDAFDSTSTRLATVSMHLQFTGAPIVGKLEGEGVFEGFLHETAAPQGLSRVSMTSGGVPVCFGAGAFMALEPPPGVKMHPVVTKRAVRAAALREEDLDRDERQILAHADAALASRDAKHSFVEGFFGYETHKTEHGAVAAMKTGVHVGNRVGHVQGGLLFGLGAATARAALPASWMLSAASAWFVSPGEGKELHAEAKITHHGRQTAVVRTEITGAGGRRVLEMVTTHARRKS